MIFPVDGACVFSRQKRGKRRQRKRALSQEESPSHLLTDFFTDFFQSGGRRSGPSGHLERDGPHRGPGLDDPAQRGLHHDQGRRLVRPDGQRRGIGHAAVRTEPLPAAQVTFSASKWRLH